MTASAAQHSGGRDEDNGGDSDGGVHSRQSTKRGSGRDGSGGDGDGSGNSDSDGNGDGDSEDKDGDTDVKGFFGCLVLVPSAVKDSDNNGEKCLGRK